jgi:peptide/nickel transport system permease protein
MVKGARTMSEGLSGSVLFSEAPPHIGEFRRLFIVFIRRKLTVIGLVIIFITALVAIFAPLLAPYDPFMPDPDNSLLLPSRQHLLGTDPIGRDTLSRIIYGAQTSMIIVAGAIFFGALIGMTIGMLAGYFGGIINMVLMRFIDALMAIPMILLALSIAAMLGGGLKNIVIALSTGLVAIYARLMCSQVLTVKENDYILASKSFGASHLRIMMRHILPNCFPPLIVLVTLMMGATILAEAGLSFLGVGVKPPAAAWGGMVTDGYRYILSNPLLSIVPGVTIMIVVFGFNMVGDGLRDALDPRLRGTL